jgi:hypothetical protein
MVDEFGTRFVTHFIKTIDGVLRSVVQISLSGTHNENVDTTNSDIDDNNMVRDGLKLWSYNGKFWMVPQEFQLPAKHGNFGLLV